jgi:spermidine/putrescine transport system ATP-binding protein
MPDTRHAIELDAVTKHYEARDGDTTTRPAVRDATFHVAEGEFFSLLGPSGCGKSTTLRMLAGFEDPTSGRIHLRGQDVTDVPPARRDVNMVFQAYALFPHMSVAQNVAFGPRVRRIKRAELAERVREALRIVRLEGLDERRPAQLSGGQQQRVALARALVNRPAALLLDEPLGALDLKLRREMQTELKAIQARTETTFVYVTHDQDEALTMSDRIAVMNEGVIEQIATPRRLYERPATPFVADFIGTSNVVDVRVDDVDGEHAVMRLGEHGRILAPLPTGGRAGDVLRVTVRPERIALEPPGDTGCSRVEGTVREVVYLGSTIELVVGLAGGSELTVRRLNLDDAADHRPGETVTLHWRARHSFVIDDPDAGGDAAPDPDGEPAPAPAGRVA